MDNAIVRRAEQNIRQSLQLGDFVRWSVFIDRASRTTYFGKAKEFRKGLEGGLLEEDRRYAVIGDINDKGLNENGLIENVYALDLKYDLIFHFSAADEWYKVREPEPYEIENVQKVSKGEALAHLKGKIDCLQKILEEAARNPHVMYGVVKSGEYICPIVIHEDKQEEDLKLIACIYARRKFRLEEMYSTLNRAKTPRGRLNIREMRKMPNTNFFVVAQEHETFEAMLAPVAVHLVNPGQLKIDELRMGYIFAAMYPEIFGKKFDEVPPSYVAFEIPKEALDLGLVTEAIEVHVSPPYRRKISFISTPGRRRMLNPPRFL